MLSDDRELASRELLQFLDKYFAVLEGQISEIRSTMAALAGDTMERLLAMSRSTEENLLRARQLLVKRTDGDGSSPKITGEDRFFKSTVAESVTSLPTETEAQTTEGDRGRSALLGYMQQVGALDERLQASMMNMVGLLSTDDVMAQRLQHVELGLAMLKVAMANIMNSFNDKSAISLIKNELNNLSDALFSKYTIEAEKQVHRQYLRKI